MKRLKKNRKKNGWKFRKAKKLLRHQRRERRESVRQVTTKEQGKQHHDHEVTLPSVVSLVDNPEQTILAARKISYYIEKNRRVFINMSNVELLSPDGILYLLSRIEHLSHTYKGCAIEGNTPVSPRCRILLHQSGFFNYVRSKNSRHISTPNILAIRDGREVSPAIAKEICDFYKEKLEIKGDKSVYRILIECMANTANHAYKSTHSFRKWWTIAVYDERTKCVAFAFLDVGVGIPFTLNKKFREVILTPTHSKLIKSALSGDFRTATKLKQRGKGLPELLNLYKQAKIEGLHLISQEGYVGHSSRPPDNELDHIDLATSLEGTLICWNFVQSI